MTGPQNTYSKAGFYVSRKPKTSEDKLRGSIRPFRITHKLHVLQPVGCKTPARDTVTPPPLLLLGCLGPLSHK